MFESRTVWLDAPRLLAGCDELSMRDRVAAGWRVPGELLQWTASAAGAPLALVRYRLPGRRGRTGERVHYVPGSYVLRTADGRAGCEPARAGAACGPVPDRGAPATPAVRWRAEAVPR